mmetsp:Transcript_11384/g.24988  ORF Transcript_11384/g.24988 Transcript_11384/m.24988 type:complete len:165 (+) Transcript_11384:704-1198(+)
MGSRTILRLGRANGELHLWTLKRVSACRPFEIAFLCSEGRRGLRRWWMPSRPQTMGKETMMMEDGEKKMAACPGTECGKLFDMWTNICPWQGSRTIRTEEAVLIALARFRPYIASNLPNDKDESESEKDDEEVNITLGDFGSDVPSDESSSDDDDDGSDSEKSP